VEEFAGDEQPVAQVAEVGVDAEFPGVAKGFDLLGLAGEGVVLAVGDGAVAEADLPVGAVFDAVGRVEVEALDLPGHAFAIEQGGEDEEAVALDEPVGPAVGVGVVVGDFVEFLVADGVAEELGDGEAGEVGPLRILGGDHLVEPLDDGLGGDVLVAVEGADIDAGDGFATSFRRLANAAFAEPEELGVLPAVDDGVAREVARGLLGLDLRISALIAGFLGAGNVGAFGVLVLEGFDGLGGFGHWGEEDETRRWRYAAVW
jgi:hypothetical protein